MGIDIVVVRHSAGGVPKLLSRNINACVINAGDGFDEHPTQALMDVYSISKAKGGSLDGLKIGIVGDIAHSRVARSDIWAMTKLGAEVTLIGPPTLMPAMVHQLPVKTCYCLDDVIEDIERVRATLGIDKIVVMGHSMFGPVPLEYALKYPEHTLGSILTGALPLTTTEALQAADEYWASSASEDRKAIREANHAELAQRDRSMASPSDLFLDQYEADVPLRFFDPEFDFTSFRLGLTTSVNMDFLNHFWGVLMREFDHTGDYGAIRTPVLVISGRYDFGAPYFLWEDLEGVMPDFRFHLFEDAGHNPMLEIPQEFDRVVVEWIESWN